MMSSEYHFAFENLDVYSKSIDFGEHIQKQIKLFPKEELYSLSSQYRRAADSIALNIAEGYPGSDAQFIKHLNIAIYSANECVVCSTKAERRNYITKQENEENRKLITELTKMLSSLRKYVRNRSF
ncbi:MAG: four helix bundle protein [Nonlabens sp.]|uniref:four helix bundle protein n=1 Tax=Nonlabens sp. TaxID=1888209 RepID=UPI003EF9444D